MFIIMIVITTGARFQASWGESVGGLSRLAGIWSWGRFQLEPS